LPNKTTTYVPTGSGQFGGVTGYYITGANPEKTKKRKELADLKKEIRSGYEKAAIAEQEGSSKKDDPSTILMSCKENHRQQLKRQATGKSSGSATGGHTGGGGGTKEDPFIQLLDNRKKQYDQYAKWINSTDESIRKAAGVEFSGLLKDGASYEEYLKGLKKKLEDEPETKNGIHILNRLRTNL
jgi:hypothetical protein